jgi:pilus assembly protein CpaF
LSIEAYLKKREEKYSKSTNEIVNTEKNHKVKREIIDAVKKRISNSPEIDIMDIESAKYKVRQFALKWIEEEADKRYGNNGISLQEKYRIFDTLLQNMFGFGVIEPMLQNEDVTEIMINGARDLFIEEKGHLMKPKDSYGKKVTFTNEEELKNIIDKIVAPLNRKVDESNPIVDARLPDGSRVNVVLSPISLDGTAMTIRRFPENPYSMKELIEKETITEEGADFLKNLVQAKYNMIVSGGTGSGKTTFLNALSMYIPRGERIITIEDSAELKFSQVKNLIRLETRPANIEGKGEIDIRSLVRTSLRMRPDRIVVGEIRGGEALDMLQAMNTGHDGSLTTGHANTALDMLSRLETMVLMAGMQLPLQSVKGQIASALDIVIQLGRLRDGSRRVVEIAEVRGMKDKDVLLTPLYVFKERGFDKESRLIIGSLEPTKERLLKREKLINSGISETFKW